VLVGKMIRESLITSKLKFAEICSKFLFREIFQQRTTYFLYFFSSDSQKNLKEEFFGPKKFWPVFVGICSNHFGGDQYRPRKNGKILQNMKKIKIFSLIGSN
jgi:hypothetical protein